MKFLDLTGQYARMKGEIDRAIKRVIESGVFIGGKEVDTFEKAMGSFVGTRYALGVNSCTDGLFLSLKALGITAGDEVITTPFTFIATAAVIVNVGATPVFADIDPVSFNINPKEVEKRITKKTKAIIPVHLFGQMADMEAIMRIAARHKLFVIEDAAQAIGATCNFQFPSKNFQTSTKTKILHSKREWRMAGSIGDMGCFSFFPTKNLGAYGDGGLVTTNEKGAAKKIQLLKNHGSLPHAKYKNALWGINSRLDALQAAVLSVKLNYLNEWNKKRLERARVYDTLLASLPEIRTPTIYSGNTHVFHEYTIRTKKRNALKKWLEKKGIPVMVYYPCPLHLQGALSFMGHKSGDFPEAEKAAREVLSLPLYPEIDEGDQQRIANTIRDFFSSGLMRLR